MSAPFVEDELRKVFDICDVNKEGSISTAHLLQLANQYLGSSHNTVSSAVSRLCLRDDVITFQEFCKVFSSILSSPPTGGSMEDAETGRKCDVDFHPRDCERSPNFESFGHSEFEGSRRLYSPQINCIKSQKDVFTLHEVDLRMPGDDRGSPSSISEFDSALGTSTASPGSGRKAHSMSDREEENFECYGEAEDGEGDSDSTSARIGDDVDGPCSLLRSPPNSLPPSNLGRRNSWVRRSLRGSPSGSSSERLVPPKRWGSFRHAPKRVVQGGTSAVASQLYRTSSFSSGRSSSAPDQDDMYSDASLEDDVLDLNHKVQMLQQQVGVLAENQVNTDDRYSRVKQDNSALQARVMMLEEQLRETEIRSEDRLADEQRRNKELIGRVEREKALTVENYSIKNTHLERERSSLVEDNLRLKFQLEKLQKEKNGLEDRVSEAEFSSSTLTQENAKMGETSKREREELRIERERGSQVIEELRCEVERLRAVEESYRKRSPSIDSVSGSTAEMEAELKQLKEQNKHLSEQVEELQAQLLTNRLEEGRTLVSATSNSLAAEFEQMTSDELRKSLKDSQEANQDLRTYIDGILLNIVENYPQLLEVKRK